jgi:hypothetical protein
VKIDVDVDADVNVGTQKEHASAQQGCFYGSIGLFATP